MAQIKPLIAELQKVAIDELGEVPARIPEDLAAFKLWIQQQPHLKARTDDQFLVQFLRGCKYSLERAKEKIDRLYALKTKYPEMFGVYDITEAKFQEVCKSSIRPNVNLAQIKPQIAELQKVAIEELGEVPARIPEDLAAFKLWLQQQAHLKIRTDDQFLIQFLRGCKYSLERAKEKINRLYGLKTKYPKMFGLYDITEVKFQEVSKLGSFIFLPTPLNETGPRIGIVSWNYDPKKYNLEELFRATSSMFEVVLMDDPFACINGISYIIDGSYTTFNHYLQLTPTYVKKFNTFMEKAIPLRINIVYVINISMLSQQVLNVILPFLSEKLQRKFVFCSLEELPNYIPLKYLPQEYGGTNSSIKSAVLENAKRIQEFGDYFKENAQYGTNENLRTGEPLDFEGSFGVGGSFRKIAVD